MYLCIPMHFFWTARSRSILLTKHPYVVHAPIQVHNRTSGSSRMQHDRAAPSSLASASCQTRSRDQTYCEIHWKPSLYPCRITTEHMKTSMGLTPSICVLPLPVVW